ncbi:MAG: hypothetical protein PHF63_00150 [Herbinix sp.]|nr:hypothetical protein [Herbinix sp.]
MTLCFKFIDFIEKAAVMKSASQFEKDYSNIPDAFYNPLYHIAIFDGVNKRFMISGFSKLEKSIRLINNNLINADITNQESLLHDLKFEITLTTNDKELQEVFFEATTNNYPISFYEDISGEEIISLNPIQFKKNDGIGQLDAVFVYSDRYSRLDYLYKHLTECFYKIVDKLLGEGYYNIGCDVYSCHNFTTEDIIAKYGKRKRVWKFWKKKK